jgi:hypothetical protein
MITPVAFDTIKYHTYTVFAVINAIMVPSVYFFFPETAYRSLEEMDGIFQKVSGLRGALDVVHVARNEPHRYDKNGDLIVGEDEEKPSATHGKGSTSESSADNGMFRNKDEENQRPEK